uniref:CCHC-type domain-containing protein n=1 Tax=Leptobrachium leishanense TaxID=445787 RepID=A0A8C5MGC5_9ANUR
LRSIYTPGKDIETFLSRFCKVVRPQIDVMDDNKFTTGKWSVIVQLRSDESTPNGVIHLPQSFMLGSVPGILYYPGQPRECRKCGREGHEAKDCKADACKNCRTNGHATKDCPRRATCNLCGETEHRYKDCPSRSYAAAAKAGVQVKYKPFLTNLM